MQKKLLAEFQKKDFRAKMFISYKEARETHYWLRLPKDTDYITFEEFKSLENDLSVILKILFKIIQSSKA